MKRNHTLTGLLVRAMAFAVCVAPLAHCGKKDAANAIAPARVVCLVGSSTIQRNGAAPAGLALGDIVRDGDTLITRASSFIVIQVGDKGVLRIQEDTTVAIRGLFTNAASRIILRAGAITSKLVKLDPGSSYSVATNTITASVRGTIFTVSTRGSIDLVSVGEGSVSVAANPGIAVKPFTETIVGAGTTAVMASTAAAAGRGDVTIELRPMGADEVLTTGKVSRIGIAPGIATASADELATIQREILRIESELEKKTGEPGRTDAGPRAEKIRKLMGQSSRTMEQIREAFERIDEVSLYSGRVIRGAIISRGETYAILTPGGIVSVPKADVQAVKVIK